MINGTNNNYGNDDLNFQDDLGMDDNFDSNNDEGLDSNPTQENSTSASDITKDDWKQLLTKVKTDKPENEKELLDIIRHAMTADLKHDDAGEEKYIGEFEDAMSESPLDYLNGNNTDEISNTDNSDGATKVDADGTRHYVANQDNSDFDLKGSGKKTHYVVDTTGNVSITPASPDETFTVTSEGKYNVFTSSSGDVFKVDSKAIVYVASDNVKGDIDANGKITFGTSNQQSLKSDKKVSDIANIIGSSISQIGSVSYGFDDGNVHVQNSSKYSVGYYQGDVYNNFVNQVNKLDSQKLDCINAANSGMATQAKNEAEDVKSELSKIQTAINEKKPEAQKSLWKTISLDISRWASNDGVDGGSGNNKAQLLFNVLYGELGEEKFKWALQNGILPSDFTNALNSSLTAVSGENKDRKEIDWYQTGGPAWTHQVSADFISEYSNSSSSEE